jgi:hypothetical protein
MEHLSKHCRAISAASSATVHIGAAHAPGR